MRGVGLHRLQLPKTLRVIPSKGCQRKNCKLFWLRHCKSRNPQNPKTPKIRMIRMAPSTRSSRFSTKNENMTEPVTKMKTPKTLKTPKKVVVYGKPEINTIDL